MHLKHWLRLCAAAAIFVEELVLGSVPRQLSCGDAVVQKTGLHRLQAVLRWRPVFGDYGMQALIQRDILAELVALLQPGTDAGEGPVLQSCSRHHAVDAGTAAYMRKTAQHVRA
jgi:hypothetical protein